ncbi:unnamed protein product [Rhizoctonia solani]|uniref:Uncharacterized protein n=1 Tax=Rhizoctonia solani TaxID=456999 RepID=A0A8H3CPQ8_9AGAM|nr:unnamed protein product [Rhizoctonia solani]
MAGAETLAGLVAASVAATGGLVIAGVIGILVAYGIMALFGFLWKSFWLIINIYNFDADHEWRTISHYNDNALISNGSWKNYTIPTFKPANSTVFPPGFEPQEPLESVVTYLSITWENDNTFMEGLGEGIVLHRTDVGMGLALKYVVHHAWDNEIGLELFESNLAGFDLEDWYDNGHWAMAQGRHVSLSGVEASGTTPKLSGSENDDYYYDVCIQSPPSVTR